MRLSAIVLAVPLAAASPTSSVLYTAEMLLEQCQSESVESQQACRGYIAGADDTISGFGRWSLMRNHWCAPEGTTLEARQRIVTAYLRARPDQAHTPAALHVVYALMQAFPCE